MLEIVMKINKPGSNMGLISPEHLARVLRARVKAVVNPRVSTLNIQAFH